MSDNLSDLQIKVAELSTELKYLKVMLPAAVGLVSLLFLIFWGVEHDNIGTKVSEALQEKGVTTVVIETKKKKEQATKATKEIVDLHRRLISPGIKVLSVNHSSEPEGKFFNFNASEVDAVLDNNGWDHRLFLIVNSRTKESNVARLFRHNQGGAQGNAHGRWEIGSGRGQWKVGDSFTFVQASVKQAEMVETSPTQVQLRTDEPGAIPVTSSSRNELASE